MMQILNIVMIILFILFMVFIFGGYHKNKSSKREEQFRLEEEQKKSDKSNS